MPGLSLQGKLYIAARSADGNPLAAQWIGNASKASIELNQNRVERQESYTGNRLPLRSMTTGRGGTFTCVFDEFSKANMAYICLGDSQAQASGTLTNWVVPGGGTFVQGDTIVTPYPGLTITSIVDSAGTPATVTANKYEVNKDEGTIKLVGTLGGLTQPFKLNGSYEARNVVGAFNLLSTEVWVRFAGVNTDDGSPIVVDLYRVRLDPAKAMELIHNDNFADFELSGTLLADLTKTKGGAGGQFYRTYLPTTV